MIAAAAHHSNLNKDLIDPRMRLPLAESVIFHAIVIALCITGLPYLKRDMPDMTEPVAVQLVNLDELPKSEHPPLQGPRHHQEPQPIKEKPPPIPQSPLVTSQAPPKPVAPKPPEPKETFKAPAQDSAVAMPRVRPKPPQPKPLKPRPMLTDEDQQQQFQSVLKNLIPPKPSPDSSPDAAKTDQSSLDAPLSLSEQDALQQQLSQCWNLMSGARYADDLIVNIRLTMNPDRTVQDAEVEDKMRYAQDSYFRAAADSALRAVRSPQCNPLELPPEKYETWKNITVTFNPKDML